MPVREVSQLIQPNPASDGDGVRLLRVFGGRSYAERFDPFVMLDEFGSAKPEDYRGGFPPHPHRGFETVTYMLKGKMEHRDHLGNVGLLEDGGVQWMTAGKGIIHSEMPKQTEGVMHGFQLWVNLPASAKMKPAAYKDVAASELPQYRLPGARVIAIAGACRVGDTAINGYFSTPVTEVTLVDVHLDPAANVEITLAGGTFALVYPYEGQARVGSRGRAVNEKILAELGAGDIVQLSNPENSQGRILLMAGLPLKEPIVQHGPFVMNTQEEIRQALSDYQAGVLA